MRFKLKNLLSLFLVFLLSVSMLNWSSQKASASSSAVTTINPNTKISLSGGSGFFDIYNADANLGTNIVITRIDYTTTGSLLGGLSIGSYHYVNGGFYTDGVNVTSGVSSTTAYIGLRNIFWYYPAWNGNVGTGTVTITRIDYITYNWDSVTTAVDANNNVTFTLKSNTPIPSVSAKVTNPTNSQTGWMGNNVSQYETDFTLSGMPKETPYTLSPYWTIGTIAPFYYTGMQSYYGGVASGTFTVRAPDDATLANQNAIAANSAAQSAQSAANAANTAAQNASTQASNASTYANQAVNWLNGTWGGFDLGTIGANAVAANSNASNAATQASNAYNQAASANGYLTNGSYGLSAINSNVNTANATASNAYNQAVSANGYLTNGTYGLNAINNNVGTASTNAANANTNATNAYNQATAGANNTWDTSTSLSAATLARQARDNTAGVQTSVNNLQTSVNNIVNVMPPTLTKVSGYNNASATSSTSFNISLDYVNANEYSYKIDSGGWSTWTSLSSHDSLGYLTVPGISRTGSHTIYIQIRQNNGGGSVSPIAKGKISIFKL